ncbi:hypothetical protein OEZ86_011694 [Tetradesmus obliquus]|nr:hypothetical protein OEZ86_011694 [Tetradesmus obliquus]
MSARYAGAGNAHAFAKYSGQGNPWQRPHGENGAIRQEPLVDPPIEAVFPRAPFNIADPPLEAGPFVFNAVLAHVLLKMSALPRSLKYYLSTLSLSRNRFKIRPVGQSTAQCGDVICFDLPNSHVNLDSLALHFKLSTDKGSSPATACVLSSNVELVESISVESNGYAIDSGCALTNHVANVMLDWSAGDHASGIRLALNGRREAAATGKFHNKDELVFNNWLGFLGSVQPRCFDATNLPLRVYVKLAAANKAFVAEGGTPAMCNIKYDDITCYVDAIDLQDGGLMYEATAKMMAKEPLELPFDRYVLTMGGPVGGSHDVLSMQVAANSVDYIAGWTVCPAGVNAATSTAENATTKRSNYLSRGFGGGKLSGSQMTINNVCYPTYRATATEAFVQTADAFGVLRGDDRLRPLVATSARSGSIRWTIIKPRGSST